MGGVGPGLAGLGMKLTLTGMLFASSSNWLVLGGESLQSQQALRYPRIQSTEQRTRLISTLEEHQAEEWPELARGTDDEEGHLSQCFCKTSVKTELSSFCNPFLLWAQTYSWTGSLIWLAGTSVLRSVPATYLPISLDINYISSNMS